MYTRFSCKVTLFLSDFTEIWVFSTDFRKNTQIKIFIKIRSVGAVLFSVSCAVQLELAVQWELCCSVRTDRENMTNLSDVIPLCYA